MFGIGTEVSPNTGRMHTVIRARGGLVASFPHPDDGIAEINGLAIPAGNDYYVDANGDNNRSGRAFTSAVSTFTKALSLMTSGRGDRLFVRPGDYAETEIDVDIADVQIIGLGADGAVGITPGSGVSAMKITANDVVLRNIRIEGDSGANYGLSVGDFSNGVLGVRVVGCLLRNGSHTDNPAVLVHGAGDLYIVGCDIAWAGRGIEFKGGSESYPSQIFILGNQFHDLIRFHLSQRVIPDNIENGKVVSLSHKGNTHLGLQDGTEPADAFLSLGQVGTSGIIARNDFATATNAIGTFGLTATVMWVANGTEAGISSARPA